MRRVLDFVHKLYHYEYWPAWAFYLPVYALWPYFAWRGRSLLFFTVANPCVPYGGSFGESKSQILRLINPKYLPEAQVITKESDLTKVRSFPVVAKPDVGERGDHVCVIRSREEALRYFKQLGRGFIVQEYLESPFEAGVMVSRDPETRRLAVTSVVVKSYLSVTGDGQRSLAELVQALPRARFQWERLKKDLRPELVLGKGEELTLEPIGNHCRGTTFLNGNHLITPDLARALEDALKSMPEFYFGRFDLKANSAKDLSLGKSIKIMELNGAFSEPGHIYDPRERLWRSWRDLLSHWDLLASICAKNVRRGHRAASLLEFSRYYFSYRQLQHGAVHG